MKKKDFFNNLLTYIKSSTTLLNFGIVSKTLNIDEMTFAQYPAFCLSPENAIYDEQNVNLIKQEIKLVYIVRQENDIHGDLALQQMFDIQEELYNCLKKSYSLDSERIILTITDEPSPDLFAYKEDIYFKGEMNFSAEFNLE